MCCFFKQKTAYEMRISDWSSDVCSSDLKRSAHHRVTHLRIDIERRTEFLRLLRRQPFIVHAVDPVGMHMPLEHLNVVDVVREHQHPALREHHIIVERSEEHTSELQSLMRISYAVFCLKKKNTLLKSTNQDNQILLQTITHSNKQM